MKTHIKPLLLLLCATSTSWAAPVRPLSSKVAPSVLRELDIGRVGPVRTTVGQAHVIIELAEPATATVLAELQAEGATLTLRDGTPIFYRRFVPAVVDRVAAQTLAARADVVRIAAAPPRGPMPLDQSARLTRLADARGARPALDLLTGEGMTIGDSDSMVDPFAPAFFKGDAGYYDWIDVDHDHLFTPGVDAIDLNRNGHVDAHEVAQLLSAATVDEYSQPLPSARPASFDPGIDWVYLDDNGNLLRDFGAASGFTDATPAMGEPLFTPDDVDKSGTIDVGERFVRLGTSKLKKIYVTLDFPSDPAIPKATDTYVRGTNLSATKVNYSNSKIYGFADAYHATGVNTILVGDLPLVGRRWVGFAPDAEVVLAWEVSSGLPTTSVMTLLTDKPDVMLYEMAPWTGDPLDGSDVLSAILDEATVNDQVTNTCPTGDQGSAGKHASADLAAGATVALPFDLPSSIRGSTTPLGYVDVSLAIQGGTAQSLSIADPAGNSYDLNGTPTLGGYVMTGAAYYGTRQTTARGVDFFDLEIYVPDSSPAPKLDVGTWTVTVGAGTVPLTVDAYISDDQSSWGLGARWSSAAANDRATIGIPSVADHCIAVNAIPDHLADASTPWYAMDYYYYDVPNNYEDAVGQIRAYTPRGPRLDGVTKPDVCAPDNPWVSTEHGSDSTTAYGAYRLFGGTSGASPHVTGVATLLAQAGLRGDAARDALRMGADHDSVTGIVPNGDYGYGRLDAATALGVTTVGKDFTVTLVATPTTPRAGQPFTLTPTASGDADAIAGVQAKWDDGYDGTWDTAYAASAPRTLPVAAAGRHPYKVRLRNGAGHIAEAVVWVGTASPSASGCSCQVGGAAPSAWPHLAAIALLLLLGRRRLRAAWLLRGRTGTPSAR